MLGRQVKVYDGSVRSASTLARSAPPASCDVAIVGAGAAGLMTAIHARAQTGHIESCSSTAPARRARRSWSAAGRAATSPTPSSPSATSGAARRTIVRRILRAFPVSDTVAFFDAHRRRAARRSRRQAVSSTPIDRATSSTRCCAARRRRGVELHSGTRVSGVERHGGCAS